MKSTKIVLALMAIALVLSAAAQSQAGTTARVRCRVETNRLRIQVDGQDLARGTYGAKIKNARTGVVATTALNRRITITVAPDDADLDFDSSKQPNDAAQATFIPYTYAIVGDTIRASVINVKTGVVVSAASTSCVAK